MLFLDLILVIIAWRKGWRYWALLPLSVFLLANLLLNYDTMALLGLPSFPEQLQLVLVDLVCSVILAAMCFIPPPLRQGSKASVAAEGDASPAIRNVSPQKPERDSPEGPRALPPPHHIAESGPTGSKL